MSHPETWDELVEALSKSNGQPVQCTAWAVGGGDPTDMEILTARQKYEAAWVVFGPRGGERVRLSRVESREGHKLEEIVRFVSPDFMVSVRRTS